MSSSLVLLAIPEEWNNAFGDKSVVDFLQNKGFEIVAGFSYEDSLKIIQLHTLSAVVMTSDWALRQDAGSPGLIEFLKGKVPTYSLITPTTVQNTGYDWFDELHTGQMHEYQSVPFDVEAIVVWLNQIIYHER